MDPSTFVSRIQSVEAFQNYTDEIECVKAVRLTVGEEMGSGNASEVALWCDGNAYWQYDGKNDANLVWVEVLCSDKVIGAKPGDWIISHGNDVYSVLSDQEFTAKYESNAHPAKMVCDHCLADVMKTQYSDEEKKCPKCSSGYIGPPRTREFMVLKAAGLVKRVE